ncbi:hypothetical protein ACIFOC_00443 [Leucobacter aridicollis]|uniref:Uncharacterized protein n=1 Tax=Leucobacter aridicollis TaxID=283878 RepID=A0A852QXK6_9MICO|nr:hypothetical protein [Leucobacter aridicollis]MBL3682649.1 hypothetical protein [Leucobacter aridicollis]NYD26081.1 hypothetical protein [Leucobacter aridicollis]
MARRDVKVKLKLTGLNKLMTSAPVQSRVNEQAARVSAAAGSKFEMVVQGKRPSRRTARAYVQPREGVRLSDADRIALLRALEGS